MPNKREERRERAEAEKQSRERYQRQKVWRSRLLLVAGVLGLIAVVVITMRRRGDESGGRVWSAAHGHWHDK